MIDLVFGADADKTRLRAAQSVGGSGALRVLADLMMKSHPDASIWVSDPTWPNHIPLLASSGFNLERYAYFDVASGSADINAIMNSLGQAKKGDIVLLHGCCHNPTGADLSLEDWATLADFLLANELFPFVDIAYQGFGDGIEEDAAGVRLLASKVPEMVVAASCSKNLGLYRERVGAAILLAGSEDEANRAFGLLSTVIRSNYSMPPDHGANSSEIILTDELLSSMWKKELESMRVRMVGLRKSFSDAMRKRSNSDRFDFIAKQKGMFSRLPLTSEQIDKLRDDYAIYLVGDGRLNVAGLPENDIDALADAICTVIADTQ